MIAGMIFLTGWCVAWLVTCVFLYFYAKRDGDTRCDLFIGWVISFPVWWLFWCMVFGSKLGVVEWLNTPTGSKKKSQDKGADNG